VSSKLWLGNLTLFLSNNKAPSPLKKDLVLIVQMSKEVAGLFKRKIIVERRKNMEKNIK
jgi:hypothetical protein